MVSQLKSADNKLTGSKGILQMIATQPRPVARFETSLIGPSSTETSFQSQVMELLVSYHAFPSLQVRNQLVRLNIGLVRKIAHRVAYQCAEPYEDLEQIGYLGLISAIERFDPTQGCAFSSFAVPYIRGEMLHFFTRSPPRSKFPDGCSSSAKTAKNLVNCCQRP